ncbi:MULTISPECIES: DUF6642 family protein [Flavobacterium]|uniref:Uncharacterized protein n=2 Tax=Flavobacterium TaxID=237 RepID=A0AA94JQU2_9FLAO|nr:MULTISPECIES: DUF6642 family protein [Flavobacterium]OXA74628.1 hypothetical protein B0A56_12525 [Flavobacterium columnare NBRC 100251 = ATCC 23463]AMA49053.1 hypothetical protein AWN65_06070 [Flavobacterium covae]AND64873.1 hypothetical protein AX766_10950 [Flavobacterium covae]MCH4830984.1 hypothetical protein [Flavobacterium columnare]MCH4833075.1 hypothetical protein [Flavobacterium columnare]
MSQNHHIYCLESVADVTEEKRSVVLASLENLAYQYKITNIYKTFDSIEGFEESISALLFQDRYFKDYAVIYLVMQGRANELKIDNYYYTFEEIAEFFEGKLKGKIIHFANTLPLDLNEETFQYFLDVTGAKALSGYVNNVPILSTILDNLYFSLMEEIDDIIDLTETLFEKQYSLCQSLGFRIYY